MVITALGAVVAAIASTLTHTAGPVPTAPPVDAGFDYQLGGGYPLPDGVTVVTRDRTDRPAAGAYNICYVNAYQTQPGRLRWWKRTHRPLLLRYHGRLLHDPGWPGEVLLDTADAAKRRAIAGVVGRWFSGCADDGFDAVEPDNLDSYTRSHHQLDRAGALALATLLADRAHHAGLAIAQKNLAGLTRARRLAVGFDFAVSEECMVWHECGSYRRAYGRHVIEIEYTDNGRAAFRKACRDHGGDWSIVLRDRMLRTPASPRYAYQKC
jgi:Glycoside-hydrolase family GH114